MRKRDEPVRLTRIYTRGGDKGETSLGDGSRVSKLDPRVAAMGDVDELNSLVGWAGGLDRVQNELFDLGADLSVPFPSGDERLRITDEAVNRLEQEIDEANATLPELKSFVLPGGSERAAAPSARSWRCRMRTRSRRSTSTGFRTFSSSSREPRTQKPELTNRSGVPAPLDAGAAIHDSPP